MESQKNPRVLQIITTACHAIVALFLLLAPYATVLYENDNGIGVLASNSNYSLIYPAIAKGSAVWIPLAITVLLFALSCVAILYRPLSKIAPLISLGSMASWIVFYALTYNGVFTKTVHPELEVQINAVYWISFIFALAGLVFAVITSLIMNPRKEKEDVFKPKKAKKEA